MKKQLSNYIKSQITISEEDLGIIVSCFKMFELPSDRHLLKRGQVLDKYYFIASGSLRFYIEKDDIQTTSWFAFKNDFFTDLNSYKNLIPSQHFIQSMEDSVLFSIEKNKMENLFDNFPSWERFVRKVWENAFINVVTGILNFQSMNAKERYLTIMKHTDLLEKVPLKYLASFLGITVTSLSRLRKNIK